MPDFERFRLLLEEERQRKIALLPALRADIASASSARQDSNVDDEHDPEGATIAFELSQASALLRQSSAGLDQVEAALALWPSHGDGRWKSKLLMRDSIADITLQQVLTRPREFDVVATPNLNGDYLSDAAAAQVGGLGMAPGANVGDGIAVFEATHGTAPKYANLDKINPGSVILSGVMMLEYMGWTEAAALIVPAIERAIASKRVTYDLARQMPGATEVGTSGFADQIIASM